MGLTERTIEQEFEAEALPHLDELFRSAVRLLSGDRDEAGDLVQDVYAQAWKSFDRYERGSNCRAWLYAILMNKVRHYYRRRGNRKVIPLSQFDDDTVLDSQTASPPVSGELSDEEVLAALDELSDDHREVILLVDVQGFSYRQSSEILETPIGTIMSRLNRGRRILRETLARCAREYGIGPEDSGESPRSEET